MTAEEILEKASANRESYTGEGMLCEDVYEAYKKYLHIPDTSVIDIIYGAIIANRMDGDPIWLFIVAPPGMTKTEFLQSVSGAKNIKSISKFTTKTLVSGLNYGGHDPSLLPQLDGKVLVIKDFTAIFGMNIQARDEIFATLRDAYDGSFIGGYGHGERNYVSKFGIVAGVTPAVEVYLDGESSLGERFLRYTIKMPKSLKEHIAFLERATGNVAKEKNMREELKKIGTRCLDYTFAPADAIVISDDIHNKIMHLAIYTATLRATVVRDKFTKEVTHKPFMEMATRISKQLQKLLMGICMFRRTTEATNAEYKIIANLAKGTIPTRIEEVVNLLYKKNADSTRGSETFKTDEVVNLVGLPKATCERLSENLVMLKVLDVQRTNRFIPEYRFTEEFTSVIENSGVYQ
jgi:Trp operon repressor